MRIFVAEDNLITRKLIEHLLNAWGHEVVLALSGKEAWEKLQSENMPKLIILDWMMPEMTGIEVCRKLRTIETEIPPYVIILTARGSKEDLVEGLDAGADDYITKPFDNNELRARINVGCRVIALQKALLEREKYKGVVELAGAVCHELNSPIQAIGGYSDLLISNMANDNPYYDKINNINEQVQKLANLTHKLSNITKYETKDYLNSKIVDIDKASN